MNAEKGDTFSAAHPAQQFREHRPEGFSNPHGKTAGGQRIYQAHRSRASESAPAGIHGAGEEMDAQK